MTASHPHKDGPFWSSLATSISVVVALVLVVGKLVAWQLSGSVAVLGSLADSLLDIIASVTAFVGVRYAMQPPDDNHRFGHDKAEAVSSLVQLVLISGTAVFVLAEAVRRLLNPEVIRMPTVAIGVMVGSIVLTLGLVALQTYAVRRSGSLATESDRAHYIGDLAANLGTAAAIILSSQLGWLRADGVAGVMAAAFLFYAVFDIGRRALPQLLDEELGPDERAKISSIARSVPDVAGVHDIRTRQAGQRQHIQLHLEFPGQMPLRVAHDIGDEVERLILEAFPSADVLIHLDPHEASSARTDAASKVAGP